MECDEIGMTVTEAKESTTSPSDPILPSTSSRTADEEFLMAQVSRSDSSNPKSPNKDQNVSVCTSVVIEIEEGDKTVIPASDSGSDTDFEEKEEEKPSNANCDDANGVVVEEETVPPADTSMIVSSSSEEEEEEQEESSSEEEDELGPSGDESESASQVARRQLLESLREVEERNRMELQNLKRFSPTDRIFPDVRSSSFHTVAVTLTDDYKAGDALIPYPATFVPKWHKDYVPMPCCPENQKTVKKRMTATDQETSTSSEQGKSVLQETTVRIWERIVVALSAPLMTCDDIARAIKSYHRFGGDLTVLEYTLDVLMSASEREKFFSTVLPGMVKLCLGLPEILTCPLPFLFRFMNYSITLSQKQIACLLANAFFSTFPKRFTYEDDFPSFNFISLMTGSRDDDRIACRAHKLRCIIHYFERVVEDMPKGVVTYTRKSVRTSKTPDWTQSQKPISTLVTLHDGNIETDGERMLQIDFANKYVGGGVLGHGCVQEEIFFVIYPELLVSRLLTERLVSCEALVVTGCERFSTYRGYSSDFEFAGDFVDCTPWNSRGRKCTQIVAIDALYITRHSEQFHPQKLLREVNKAFIGFSNPPGITSSVPVATGKWGCGAFRGDAHLKTLLQLLAASQAGRGMVLFTFGDLHLQKEVEEIYTVIKGKTIREVWALLLQYYKLFCSRQNPKISLHEFVTQYSRTVPPVTIETGDVQSRSPSSKSPGGGKPKSSPRRSGGMNLKQFILSPKRLSERHRTADEEMSSGSKSDNWLHKLSDTKSGWNNIKAPASNHDDSNQKLTDEQIAALLDNDDEAADEAMEVDVSVTETLCREDERSELQKESTAAQAPSSVSKRSSPVSAVTTSEPATVPSTSGIPKHKRQMTLADFYKPLQR